MNWSPTSGRTPRVDRWLALLAAVGLQCVSRSAQARINVDTVPARNSVQLTIYNSVDLTMVRETRYLTLRKGLNQLEFSWANTLIDPTSVEFKALSHADEVEVLDVSFPPRVTNTLEWRINSEFSGEVQVEIRYFTSGISWEANYLTEASRNEKLANLAGYVKVKNDSGEDYDNAQVRLVVGVIKLVEEIANLARMEKQVAQPASMPSGAVREMLVTNESLGLAFLPAVKSAAEHPKEVVKEGLSEYFLYTVEGRESLPNGWAKQLPSFVAKDVPLTSYYKYERETWGDQVERFYKFKNEQAANLGNEPLPNGDVIGVRRVSDDGLLSFVGETAVKYIPINEDVEMDLGADQEVMVEPKLVDWRKDDLRFNHDGNVAGWTVTEDWQLAIQNSKEIDVTVDLRRNFSGDWNLRTPDKYEKVDAGKVKFLLPLKAHEKRTITYELVTHYGTNISR